MAATEPVNAPDSIADIWAKYDGLTNSKYFHEYISRLLAGRDMHTYVTAASETGVGKTTCAASICYVADTTGWGAEQATLDPAEYAHLYDKQNRCQEHNDVGEMSPREFDRCNRCEYALKPGSWLLGDEWEQAVDSRRSTSKENVEASHAVATKRYRQIFGMYTLPSKSWMDNRFSNDAADFWIKALSTPHGQPKGEAIVYRLKTNEHYEQSYTERTENISWPVLDDEPFFKELQYKKRERMEGKIQRSYIHRDEVEKMRKNFWNKATKKARYSFIHALSQYGLNQSDIADVTTLAEDIDSIGQSQVSRLLGSESFESYYDG